MRKKFTTLLIIVASLGLLACGKANYKHDGVFTAIEVSENYGDPQITWVSVLVEKGKVKEFFIDERQTKDGIWNEKTKKELKYDYGMQGASDINKEWFEQAETIELFFLKHGVEKLSVNKEGYVDNLAGATMIADNYQRLAEKALDKAKKGIYTAFEVSDSYGAVQLTWVDAYYNNKGSLEKYYIDELQSTENGWNQYTKKELGYEYGMQGASPINKEWFEQAETIERFMLENSPENLKLDEEGYIDGLTGATMIADSYQRLAIKARDFKGSTSFNNGSAIFPDKNDENEDNETLVFNYDGKFLAFETSNQGKNPQITWVEVIIYNGKIHSYYIDELQSNNGKWNEKSKKELGYDYNMRPASPIGKEWFDQAYEIEEFFLKFGPENISLDNEGYVDNIAGATMIGTSYKDVAIKALKNASKGIYTAFETSENSGFPQLTWVEVKHDGTDVESYYIDELQSGENGWNEKSKKELGFDYNMKPASPINKEWFEQAEEIEKYMLENGPDKINLDNNGYIDNITNATMIGSSYKDTALLALTYIDDIFEEDFKYDGTFTAFEANYSYGSPQLTWVNVVIENGKIKSYYIDELQTFEGSWNEKSKKELGYDYNMKPASPIGKEWFEQAEVIENYFLSNKPWKINLNEENYVDGITGATMIANTYRDLAIKALINAKYGVYTAFETGLNYGAVEITWVNAFVNEEGIYKYYIDELQSNNGKWNEKSKKELGFDYNMKPASPIGKEWFEQALVLENKLLETIDNEDWIFDKDGFIDVEVDGVLGSTMVAEIYYNLAVEVSKLIK